MDIDIETWDRYRERAQGKRAGRIGGGRVRRGKEKGRDRVKKRGEGEESRGGEEQGGAWKSKGE